MTAAAARALTIGFAMMLLTAAVYRRVPTAFLRAESGWYLCVSHADPATQRRTVRELLTRSHSGHYAPFAFLAEFAQAKVFGTSRNFWHWRQVIAVAAVGVALVWLLANVARLNGLAGANQFAIAAAFSALILFQPAMVEFVSWPFMIMQLIWLLLSAIALGALVKLSVDPNAARWLWTSTTAAYASMHALGLGLATVAGVAAGLVAVARQAQLVRGSAAVARRRLLISGAVMLILATVHALAMLALGPSPPTQGAQRVGVMTGAQLMLGFLYNFICAGLSSFTLRTPAVPSWAAIAYCWPFGCILLVAFVAVMWRLLRSRATDEPASTPVLLFSLTGVTAMVALIGARQLLAESQPFLLLPYFTTVPRYIIPLQLFLVGPLVALAATIARRLQRLATLLCFAVVAAAVAAQFAYQRAAMPFLTPATAVSHYTAWRLLLDAARECRAANLPLPNFSLATLTAEFDEADVRSFVPLMRHDLQLGNEQPIALVSQQEYRNADPHRYDAAPAVRRLDEKLALGRD